MSSLREQQHQLIHQLADCIEASWSEYLSLEKFDLPSELGYVEGKLEGEKLVIENRCFQSREFRKLHLELARVGSSLDILHCVMFPRINYALPMFGADLVGGRGQISAAIVDLSPLNADRILPDTYHQALSNLSIAPFTQKRNVPEWGDIFSPFCLFIRPSSTREETEFLATVKSYLAIHCQAATAANPVSDDVAVQEILAAQNYYCSRQQQNDKTRRVLEKAFGEEWAEFYMTKMLFDAPSD